MKRYLFIVLTLLMQVAGLCQTGRDCFEIRHMDHFGISDKDTIKWDVTELENLIAMDLSAGHGVKKVHSNFMIPLVMFQLRAFHPLCGGDRDTIRFHKLKALYAKIRQKDIAAFSAPSLVEELEMIREDYYRQVEDDSILPYMSFTLDDGPFYGQEAKLANYKQGRSLHFEFGSVYINTFSTKVYLTVTDREGKHLWTRIMTRNDGRPLTDLVFSNDQASRTSLGYCLHMYSEGEALRVFLKPDGRLRYYYHSW